MKLKTMDIQKFLLTGWYPKMSHNVLGLYAGWELKNKSSIYVQKQNRITKAE